MDDAWQTMDHPVFKMTIDRDDADTVGDYLTEGNNPGAAKMYDREVINGSIYRGIKPG